MRRVLLLVLLLLPFLAPVAQASGGTYAVSVGALTVPAGTVVPGNASVAMGAASIDGTVQGSVQDGLGPVAVNGRVGRDVTANLGPVTVNGAVGGNVQANMGTVTVDGRVGGDVRVSQGQVMVNGTVGRDIRIQQGTVTVTGLVLGNVDVTTGSVTLDRGGRVLGGVHVVHGLVRRNGGTVKGGIIVNFPAPSPFLPMLQGGPATRWSSLSLLLPWNGFGSWWVLLGLHLLGALGTYAVALLVFLLFPQAVDGVGEELRTHTGRSLLIGFLVLLAVVPAMVLLAISILGLPLIPLALLALVAAAFFGYVAVAQELGQRLRQALPAHWHPFITLLAGVLLLSLVGLVPFLGGLIQLVAILLGLGAVLASRFGTGRPWLRRQT